MNERILELANKAGREKYHCSDEMLIFGDENIKKFAELILTDVVDILATYRVRVIFEDGFEHNCEHPINAIRKHFGVER